MKELKESYRLLEAAFIVEHAIEPGDTVRVLRSAKSKEGGWDNAWVSEMNLTVGTNLKVAYQGTTLGEGIRMENGLTYPFYVLEKVESVSMSGIDFKQVVKQVTELCDILGIKVDKG